jgi:hypothetical protein
MALAVPKIILAGANLTIGNAGAYWQQSNITVNTAGVNLNVTIPAGVYYMNTPANCSVYMNMGGASNVVIVAANAASGVVISDGVNTYANTTTNGTITAVTVNGGAAAAGTFFNV